MRARIALVMGVTAAGMALAAGSASAAVTPNPWLTNRFLNIAHQGGEDEAPSNTLYAFKSAVSEGNADMLELDVHLTSDGHLVVIHDDTVSRTTDGPQSRPDSQIRGMTLAQVQSFDAGYWFRPNSYSHDPGIPASEFTFRGMRTGAKAPPAGYGADDFRIPTLKEVFDAFPNTPINIEIKMPKSQDPANPYPASCGTADGGPSQLCDDLDLTQPTTQALADFLVNDYPTRRDVIVVSFAEEPMQEFATLAPDVNRAPAQDAMLNYLVSESFNPDPVAMQVPPTFSNLDVPALLLGPYNAHGNGYAVHIWTNGDEDETFDSYSRLYSYGVDGIMTTSPRLLNDFLCKSDVPHPDGSSRCEPVKKKKCKKKGKGKGKGKGKAAAAKKKKKKKCKKRKKGKKKGKRK